MIRSLPFFQVVKVPRLDSLSRASALCTSSSSLLKLDLLSRPGPQASDAAPSSSERMDATICPLSLRQVALDGYASSFKITALREERIFALMLWFDVSLTSGEVRD